MRARAVACGLLALALALVADAAGARALDVSPWDRVLVAHASGGGVDYAGLRADATAVHDLDAFLAAVATMPETEGIAAWLDAYNATVVRAVLGRYPLRSVRDVPGFFDHVPHRIAGQDRTLDEVETLIRTRFHDARVHAALNCGARSCPALASRAFTDGNVEASLDRLARAFVANDQHVHVAADGSLVTSELLGWYAADFERDAGSVLAWLRRYDAGRKLAHVADGVRTTRRTYDWRVNDFPKRRAPASRVPVVHVQPPTVS